MKKKLLTIAATAACAVAVGGLSIGVAGTASAEDGYLCNTVENAPFYLAVNGSGGAGYLFTLSPGRGFNANGHGYIDGNDNEWIEGHGAEHPDREGWVLRGHTTC